MQIYPNLMDTIIEACKTLERYNIDYRVTGDVASNVYGASLATTTIDIVVESENAVYAAIKVLGLPESGHYDPYVCYFGEVNGSIRIQSGDMGMAFMHPGAPFKLHSQEHLLLRSSTHTPPGQAQDIENDLKQLRVKSFLGALLFGAIMSAVVLEARTIPGFILGAIVLAALWGIPFYFWMARDLRT